MPLRPDQLADHYDRIAEKFNSNWASDPDLVSWLNREISARLLPLRAGDRAADIGCGTGLYAGALASDGHTVVCVDPSAKMLARLPSKPEFVPIRASLEELDEGSVSLPFGGRYDAVLAKDVIHHTQDWKASISTLTNILSARGKLLVVTPPTSPKIPLFDTALQRYEEFPDPSEMTAFLAGMGMNVQLTEEGFRRRIAKKKWLTMVADRYISVLSEFEDEALSDGLAEIDARYAEPFLEFDHRLFFVLASSTR
ncbi:class I SAM-dependent methyltransferase [Streptomyces sp. NBC_00669]|uniref:class I SAM-dependent methyltransferase n=1 Tax=Streptomyces sp. NBC_00669 TaxID=2976011 RepID=UPI002E334BBB|nr:class I SAM-dependent methyltransferase [Streptomyces sp. NBC_00669]